MQVAVLSIAFMTSKDCVINISIHSEKITISMCSITYTSAVYVLCRFYIFSNFWNRWIWNFWITLDLDHMRSGSHDDVDHTRCGSPEIWIISGLDHLRFGSPAIWIITYKTVCFITTIIMCVVEKQMKPWKCGVTRSSGSILRTLSTPYQLPQYVLSFPNIRVLICQLLYLIYILARTNIYIYIW